MSTRGVDRILFHHFRTYTCKKEEREQNPTCKKKKKTHSQLASKSNIANAIMAHLLRSYPNTSIKLYTQQPYSHAYTLVKPSSKELRFGYLEKGRNFLSKSFSSSSSTEEVSNFVEDNGRSNYGDEFEYLASDFGWKVRRLGQIGDEMRSAARVQAEAFHEPFLLFNDFFFEFFQAEVLAGLIYKLRNSPPNRYACLVAVPETEASNKTQQLVGVVDITALRDENVLKSLPPDAEEYLYISGIAVLENFRRKKIATVLLKACDMLAIVWGFKYLVLRAYEDDVGARKLYTNAGYRIVSGDPPWLTTWIGRKRLQ
ncbi:uncharacterized protein LOC112092374 [Morus notabilis]|uniref:uncharacterized protein LOC112092374 n=1 Tax=Morus notabilis TaxID=981085 RepID=UPI000CED6FBF|nr:uncharacterized protein LOC112092374 [Morus notabilis]